MATKQAQNKTQAESSRSVEDFLNAVENEQRRTDALAVLEIMHECTGFPAQMWGTSIVGFGTYHYKYESGREGDMPIVGFSPRKQDLTLYLVPYYENRPAFVAALERLGKHKTGKACLYLKKLSDVDESVLRELISMSVQALNKS
ncbi:MAG: DUF1801 domain-containing protein [Candidatus Kapaibacteriota bacterium]